MQRSLAILESGLLRRERLGLLLRKAEQAQLITVIAGPGYGKTTAVANYMQRSSRPLVWMTLTNADNDPAHFWHGFATAVSAELGALGEELRALSLPETVERFDHFLHVFTSAIEGIGPVNLVFDGYSEVSDPGVQYFIKTLIEIRMPSLCLCLISEQAFHAGTLVGEGGQFRIAVDDLRFTQEEIRELFLQYGTELTDQQCKKIAERTDGWPLAVQLLCTTGEGDADRYRGQKYMQLITELFELGYFAGYQQSVQMLLVKLSFLPYFSAGLVRLLGNDDTAKALSLLSMHPFVSYDYHTQLFTYQTLYRQFLSLKQEMLGEAETRDIFVLAGGWFLGRKDFEAAMECYWSAKDYQNYLKALFEQPLKRIPLSQAGRILRRLDEIPASYYLEDPLVDFCRGMIYLNNQELDKAHTILSRLILRLQNQGSDTQEEITLLGDIYAVLAEISLERNRIDGLPYIQKAAEIAPDGCRVRTRDTPYVENNDVFFLPDNQPGRLQETVDYIYRFAQYAGIVWNGSGMGIEHLFAAQAYFYSGDMSLALEYAFKAAIKAQLNDQHDIVCNSYWIQLRIAMYYGNYEKMQETLSALSAYAEAHAESDIFVIRDSVQHWYHIQLGELDCVSSWIVRHFESGLTMPFRLGRSQAIYAYYLIAKGEYIAAYRVLLQLENIFVESGRWDARLITSILNAISLLKRNQPKRSAAELFAAYEMTAQNYITIPFLEFGENLAQLIQNARNYPQYHFSGEWMDLMEREAMAYENRLSGMKKSRPAKPAQSYVSSIALTAREKEVLTYLANGLTREEISAALYISVHGVKKHITNIYNKLGAVNRADAIHIAAMQGILEEE